MANKNVSIRAKLVTIHLNKKNKCRHFLILIYAILELTKFDYK